MGAGYLLDSNAIIGYLAGKIPAPGMEFISGIVDRGPCISVISQIEVLRFTDTPENESILAGFVTASFIQPLSDAVVQQTIALCRRVRIKLPDAIIAATAITGNFTLVTRNLDDFKNIPEIELFNPWDVP